ncbi:GDSL-type esterase/lipase family protein [Dokdonia sp.]|uniref:SGNH/GDSL hydrolase family protein n=1 Tax=Dokdonia sp. TaxID=2024995 RepID=UPI003266D3DD
MSEKIKLKKIVLWVLFTIGTLFSLSLFISKYQEQLSLPDHEGKPIVVMFGDSHTYHGDWKRNINQYNPIKLGWGGYTSDKLVEKTSKAVSFKPKYVFILCGGNDISYRSSTLENTLNNLKLIADTLKNNNITPVFQKLMYQHNNPEFNASVDSLNKALTDYCYKEQIDIIDIGKKMYDDTGLKASLTSDNLHLNKKGYIIWYKVINDYLENH